MSVSTLPESYAMRLSELPEFTPSEDLRERILARVATPTARRWKVAASLAAAAVLAGVLLAPRPEAPGPAHGLALPDAVADTQARSRALESHLALTPRSEHASAGVLAAEAELARVDLALQSAYDRNAPAAELEPLWRLRTDLLGALVTAYRNPESLVRI